jgi:hypothetical protein
MKIFKGPMSEKTNDLAKRGTFVCGLPRLSAFDLGNYQYIMSGSWLEAQ